MLFAIHWNMRPPMKGEVDECRDVLARLAPQERRLRHLSRVLLSLSFVSCVLLALSPLFPPSALSFTLLFSALALFCLIVVLRRLSVVQDSLVEWLPIVFMAPNPPRGLRWFLCALSVHCPGAIEAASDVMQDASTEALCHLARRLQEWPDSVLSVQRDYLGKVLADDTGRRALLQLEVSALLAVIRDHERASTLSACMDDLEAAIDVRARTDRPLIQSG